MPMRRLTFMMALLAACALTAGCGGGGGDSEGDALRNVPDDGGLRTQVREAGAPAKADFPAVDGRSLQEVADSMTGGPEVGLAGQTFTVGRNRLAFGVIDPDGKFVYGKSAVYVAPQPGARARGPYPAPADVLVTDPSFRSRQAASETDLFAAVYAADVPLPKTGTWSVLVVTESGGGMLAAPTQVEVKTGAQDTIPDVGEAAPRAETDTVASAKGDEEAIDTRLPPGTRAAREVLRRRRRQQAGGAAVRHPAAVSVARLRARDRHRTPAQAKYGDRMEFIHQEVYVENDPNKGCGRR